MKDIESIKLNSEEKDKLKNFKINKKILDEEENKLSNTCNKKIILFYINKFYIWLKNNKPYFHLITVIIINIYGLYYYLESLHGCKNSRAFCLYYYSLKELFHIFFYILRASISFSIISVYTFWQLISLSNYLIIISIYFTLFIFDHYDDFEKHGYYNFYAFIILNSIGVPLLIYLTCLVNLFYHKLFKHLLYCITPAIIIFIIFYIRYLFLLNCYGYNIGLNGVKIDDNPNKYSCFSDYPKNCYIDILSPFMDYSYHAGNCKTIRSLENQKKYFTYFLIEEKEYEKTTKFGFPITTTEKFSLRTQNDVKHFNERVSENIIDMDKYNNITNNEKKPLKPEVILDFSEDTNGEIKININKNITLSEERKTLGLKYKSTFDNILFIFIDALSREHFKRKLKKTTKFIEKFMKKNNDENLRIINHINL